MVVRPALHLVTLGLALCVWLVASASHVHVDADEFSSKAPSAVCSFCLSLPSAATPTVHVFVARPRVIAIGIVDDGVQIFVAIDVPSFYLSRGPPAS